MQVNIPVINKPRVVIIGGGFGGLALSASLKRKDFQVVLIDRNNYHTFQPLLYQVATAGLEPDSIAYPLRRVIQSYSDFIFRLAEVERIDPAEKTVYTNLGSVSYDFLVLATGSQTNFFGLDSVRDSMMPLKSVPHALNLRSLFFQNFEQALLTNDLEDRKQAMNVIVVGGGPTGVELAGALGEMRKHVLPKDYPELDIRQMEIHLYEAGPRLLAAMSEKSSAKALSYLEALGVQVWLNTAVEQYENNVASLSNGNQVAAKTLIWAAGVAGALVPGIPAENIDRGRVTVDRFNKMDGPDGVYAIGDIASMSTEKFPKGHPMVAQVALQMARNLGRNLVRESKGQEPRPFTYNDKGSMATVGRNKAVVDLPGFRFSGIFAWAVWMFIHIMSLIGFRNKVVTFVDWVWNYLTWDRSLRLIIRPFKRTSGKKEATPQETTETF